MSKALQNHAMLVSLNISQWTARKHDRAVSNEVDKAHNAKDAGRYNKLLIRKEALEPMEQIAAAARQHLYKVTFPWGDNGDRLLPAALFLEFAQTMQQFRNEFDSRVHAFVREYPTLVQEARTRLGTLYDPADYPADVKSRFVFNPVSVTPVPSAQDFRVDLGEQQVEQIRAEITERMNERQDSTRRECWTRLRSHVQKLSERLGDPKAKIFDSLITNPEEFLAILPALNLTGDKELNDVADDVKRILLPPDRLRQDKRLRADMAARASEILQRMP